MRFKNKHSDKAFFTVGGSTRQCIKGIYETEDKEEIKFLKENSNFIIAEDKEAETIKPEVKKEDVTIEDNDQKTRDFIVKNWGV